MTFVKFCGMTRSSDVQLACEFGVQAVGFVLWPKSPRHVPLAAVPSLVALLPQEVLPVGVFVNPTMDEIGRAIDAGVRVVQIHGGSGAPKEISTPVWIAVSVDADLETLPEDTTLLLDAFDPVRHGGTGRTIDWGRAAVMAAGRRVVLAGGLTAANVGEAIARVRPYGVDVASGVEERPGVKDARAMRAFVAAVRATNEELRTKN